MTRPAIPSVGWHGWEVLVVSPVPTHPPDCANRQRVHRLCATLQRLGAKLHLAYFPADRRWVDHTPLQSERAMAAQWDGYHSIVPSRSVYRKPLASAAPIDSWADPAVNQAVAWICATRPIDIVIVTYAWLSFCLKSAPLGVFTVCATPAVVSDPADPVLPHRSDLDAFATEPGEEAVGLTRADLVLAPTPEDEAYIRTVLGVLPCLTLPHADPGRALGRRAPDPAGWLRVGFAGPHDALTETSFREFLRIGMPLISRCMAPVRLVVAGGYAASLVDRPIANLELVPGDRVPESFYRSVDLVMAPISRAAGMRIELSAAMAAGVPVLATRQAMHGIPTDEPRHLLADPGALARALVELAFDPAPLPALAARSVALAETLRERSMAAFEEVRRRIAGGDTERVCIVAPVQALDPSCLLHDHLRAVLQRLGRTGHAVLYLVGPAAGLRSAAVARLDRKTRIFVTPSLADGAPDWWTPVDLVDLLAARGMVRAYFLASPDRLPPFWAGTLDRVLIRADLLAAAGQGPRGLVQSLLGQARLGMVGWDARRLRCWAGGTIEIIQAGFGGEAIEPASRHPVPPVRSPADQRLVVLGDPADIVTASLAAIGRALGRAVEVIDPRLDAVRPWLWRGLLPPGEGGRPVALTQARLIADLSENDELAALIRDCAARRGVATVRFLRGERAIAAFPAAPVSEPGSVARLMRTVGRALGDDAALAELVEDVRARLAEDPGWQQIEAFLRGSDPVSRSLVPAAG